ncbi:MAG: heavy-metal-associated domain-containing protein [Patescibacteria group bacterium]
MQKISKKPQTSHQKQVKLKIQGMHCVSCAMNIDMQLEELPGVINSDTNFAKSQTQLTYKSDQVDLANIKKVIEEIGYQAEEI